MLLFYDQLKVGMNKSHNLWTNHINLDSYIIFNPCSRRSTPGNLSLKLHSNLSWLFIDWLRIAYIASDSGQSRTSKAKESFCFTDLTSWTLHW